MTTADDLRRCTSESRLRLASAKQLQEQYAVIAVQSRRRLDAGRQLLDRHRASSSPAASPTASPAASPAASPRPSTRDAASDRHSARNAASEV